VPPLVLRDADADPGKGDERKDELPQPHFSDRDYQPDFGLGSPRG
jgi:hypothetical protein